MRNTMFFTLSILLMAACSSSQAGQQDAGSGSGVLQTDCAEMPAEACEVFRLTNLEREKAEVPLLTYSSRCFQMAQEQSDDMKARSYFDHSRPAFPDRPAESFQERATRFGLQRGIGENIAMTPSPAVTVQMWMNSPGHRKNILNPDFRSFAVGYQDGLYTQDFWVNEESR